MINYITKVPITVVATVYNDSEKIEELIINIQKQTYLPEKFIIVDGGSYDDTVNLVRQYYDKVVYELEVIWGERLNIAEGLNKAVKLAKNEIIIIVAVGNTYSKQYIEELYKIFIEGKADITYSLIRGKSVNFFSYFYNLCSLNGNRGRDFGIATNHGCLIKKSVIEENGYFYEKFIYAGEDAEFFNMLKCKKYRMLPTKEAELFWETSKSITEWFRQIEVYTVADMQIYGSKIVKKSILQEMSYIVLLLFVVIVINTNYGINTFIIFILFITYVVLCIIKKNILIHKIVFQFIYTSVCLIFVIRNKELLNVKYRVKR